MGPACRCRLSEAGLQARAETQGNAGRLIKCKSGRRNLSSGGRAVGCRLHQRLDEQLLAATKRHELDVLADLDAHTGGAGFSRPFLGQLAEERARKAGAASVSIEISEDIKLVPLGGGKELFIEALVQATADGAAA